MNNASSILPFLEIIEWVEHSPNLMLWKVPDGDREIKNGAKLIVRESQRAILLDQGKIADTFDSGNHTLSTQNIPVLSRLKGWKYGFESPFKADVYFFSTKQFVNLKWGTPAPVLLDDPKFGQVRLRAFGTYTVRIIDPSRFFSEFAGTYPELTITEFQQMFRDYISPRFGEALAQSQIPLIDIAGNLTELNSRIEPLVAPYLEEFGVTITQFTVTSVTLPKEVTGFFDKVTGMNMVGDSMEKFHRFNAAIALDKEGSAVQRGMEMGVIMKEVDKASTPEAPTAPAAPNISENAPVSIEQKLKQLKSLFDSELIDEDEYKSKKSELLSNL